MTKFKASYRTKVSMKIKVSKAPETKKGSVSIYSPNLSTISRGRGDRTPINGFGDRRTTIVLFPCVIRKSLTKNILSQTP